jgi:PAS domain S-box-containing protein
MTPTPSSEKTTPQHDRVLHVWSSPLIERAVSFIAVSRAKPLAFRLALSTLFVEAAFIARTTLFPDLSTYPSYIPFHAAVILAAVFGGAWGCLTAAALSIAAVHTFFMPISQPVAIAPLIVFASTAVLLAVMTELLGLAQRGLLIAEQQRYRDAYWRLFIEQAPVAIAMFDRQMRSIAASSKWSDRHDQRNDAGSGLQQGEAAPRLPIHLKDEYGRALAGETVRCDEEEITLAGGTRLIERWEMVPWREPDGSIGGATIFSEDISPRVSAERELRESKENLKRAQAIARVANWRMNFASGRLKGSAQTFELLGQAPDAALDYERLLAMVDEADRRRVGETRKSALRGEAYDIEYRYVVNGRTGWMREYSKPEYDTAGHLVGAFGVIQDVTDRKLIEMNLSTSEERLRLALEAAGMAVWDLDLRTGKDVWNDQSFRMIRYEPGEIKAGYATWLGHVHPDDRTAVDDAFKKSLADGTEQQSEYRVIDRNGTIKWVSVRGRSTVDNTGKPVRSFGVITDVTERKQAEERDRILSAEVTHRAKNLLAVVQAVAIQTARNQKPNEFLAAFNERLKSLAVSHDLLVNSNWQAVEIGALVRSQLAHFEDLFSKRINFRGPSIGLTAEAAQAIGLALHELVTNASKYGSLSTPAGVVTIEWSVDRTQTPSRFNMFWKESGGPPVNPPDQRGFGHSVLVNMAAYALGADVALQYPADGVSWTLEAPAGLIIHSAASGAAA